MSCQTSLLQPSWRQLFFKLKLKTAIAKRAVLVEWMSPARSQKTAQFSLIWTLWWSKSKTKTGLLWKEMGKNSLVVQLKQPVMFLLSLIFWFCAMFNSAAHLETEAKHGWYVFLFWKVLSMTTIALHSYAAVFHVQKKDRIFIESDLSINPVLSCSMFFTLILEKYKELRFSFSLSFTCILFSQLFYTSE